jgi:hypothetical protein|uniref:SprT-like family protein n=1 Tax=Myoviridae sp. ctshb19 TaxID=2825194 RepID=A0A8S5UGR1_9CAUD|nr:MAG TPA: SprT-like family protein [Myoviridae sp. ctshb19]
MANYRYLDPVDRVYDNANDEYDLHMVQGDRFTMYRHGSVYIVQHEDAPDVMFRLKLKEGNALHNASEELLSVEVDPENPPYLLFKPTFEIVPQIYDYLNHAYFNNACPVVKFVKSRNPKLWGMAQVEFYRGKPVYTFHINESAMIDRVLFLNTIAHEMIHLRNFAEGIKLRKIDPKAGHDLLHDDHGPAFHSEMNRLNAHGFGIIVQGTHEEFQRKATEEFYAIIVMEVQHGKAVAWNAWYTDKVLTEEDTDRLASQLKDMFPHVEYSIKLVKTKDRNVTHGNHLKAAKTFTDATLKKKFPGGIKLDGEEVLYTGYLRPSIHVELPDFKERPEVYAMPLDQFYKAMRSYTDDRLVLKAKWMKFPPKMLNTQIDTKFSVLCGRMGRNSIEDADIVNVLNDMFKAYDQRQTYQQYKTAMLAFIDKYDKKGRLAEYAKIMRLVA